MRKRSRVVLLGASVLAAVFAGALALAHPPGASAARDGLSPVEAQAVDVAIATGALPTSVGPEPSFCPTEDVAITYEPIPASSFRNGAYVEPLLPPGADPHLVTGIAYCVSSPLAVMGFDAVRTDQGWQIWPIPTGG